MTEKEYEGARLLDEILVLFGLHKETDDVIDRALKYVADAHSAEGGPPMTVSLAILAESKGLLPMTDGGTLTGIATALDGGEGEKHHGKP